MPDEAEARSRAARLLSDQGRAAEARQQLEMASDFYRAVEGRRYLEQGGQTTAISA
jgi:hypothetical protein